MKLTIEMHRPDLQLIDELTMPGITQASVAITYAFAIVQEGEQQRFDWAKMNAAICAKWTGKTALERIKKAAWKQVEHWSDGRTV